MDDPNRLLGGRYRLERLLGSGGMATVHLAVDTTLQIQRAIKLLNKNYASSPMVRERFVTEAHAQARLRHPNILMVHDVQLTDQGVYMVMDVAENGSLSLRVKERGPLSPAEACEAAITLLGALELAHKFNVIHRDIKPENVLVDAGGTLKLADFGIARVVDRNANMTRTGMTMGTWAYMPPEQRNSAKSVDGRADLYALGASIYYLVTAKEPFDLHNTESYNEAFEGFPEALGHVVRKATRFMPTDRYDDCEDMRQALMGLRGQLATTPVFQAPAPPRTMNLAFDSTLVPGQIDGDTLAPIGPQSSTIHTQAAPVMSALPTIGDATIQPIPFPTALHREETLLKRDIIVPDTPESEPEPVPEPKRGRGWMGIVGVTAAVIAAIAIGRSFIEPTSDEPVKEAVEPATIDAPPVSTQPSTEPTTPSEPEQRTTKPVSKPTTTPTKVSSTSSTALTPLEPPPVTTPPPEGPKTYPFLVRSIPYGAAMFVDGASAGKVDRKPRYVTSGKHPLKLVITVDGQEKEKSFDLDVKTQGENYLCWDFTKDSEC